MMSSNAKFWMVLVIMQMFLFVRFACAQSAASELFAQGQERMQQGDILKAIDFYEKSIDADPDFAPAYSALGQVYLDQNGNIDDIVWLFQQAADLEPQNAQHYSDMCRAYFQYQKSDWAQAACLKALALDPNAGAAKVTLAWVCLFGTGQPAEAIKYFKEVIEKIPNPKMYYGLGLAYARNNEQANALDVITTLRGMGEETLAGRLEAIMRSGAGPVGQRPDIPIPNVHAGSSEIVRAQVKKSPEPAINADSSVGKIRIQLRARLPSGSETASSSQETKVNPMDDGYDLEDYKPLTLKERQDRVRRMRGNTSKARGQAVVTTQTQAAP